MTEKTTLGSDLRLYGDDVSELIEAYAIHFGVDLAKYLWYFHTGEEGFGGLGGMIFPPPQARVKEIPITLGMLTDFAEQGRWAVEYPAHALSDRRYDLMLNKAVLLGIVGAAAAIGIRSCRP